MKKANVYIYLGYSWDQPTIENRITPIAKLFNSYGHKCLIRSPGIKEEEYELSFATLKVINGGINRKENILLRAFKEIISAYKVSSNPEKHAKSIHLYTIPSFMLLIFGKLHKGFKILDIRDALWVYLKSGPIYFRFLNFFLTPLIKRRLFKFDLITCTNEFEKEEILHLTKGKVPIKILSNGISIKKFNLLNFDMASNSNEELQITYAGNVGYAQNLEIFIKSISSFPNIVGNIVGEGADLDRLKKYVAINNIYNIKFHGKLSWEELRVIYQNSSILYCQLSSNYNSAIPSKLYEYLSTNRSIIFSGEGAAIEFLKQFEGVYFSKSDDYLSLNKTIASIISKNKTHDKNLILKNRDLIKEKYIRELMTQKVFKNKIMKLN